MTDTPTPTPESLRSEAEAMKMAVNGIDTEGFFHRYNWEDKPHRVVYDAHNRMKLAADAIEALAADLAAQTNRADGLVQTAERAIANAERWEQQVLRWRTVADDANAQTRKSLEVIAALESKLSNVISHATMGAMQDPNLSLNEIGVAITRIRNEWHTEKTAAEAKVAKLVEAGKAYREATYHLKPCPETSAAFDAALKGTGHD